MTTTQIKVGQTITATSTETAYTLGSDHGPLEPVFLVWRSGSFQYTVAPITGAPVLDVTYETVTADKVLVTVGDGNAIRIKGSGTLVPNY